MLTSASVIAEPLSTPDIDDIEYPVDMPPSAEEIMLGKYLFFDPQLSGNHTISCATCHNPDNGFGDGLKLSAGHDGKPLTRHTPPLYNLAWSSSLFWDGRASSLEHQVLMPIYNPSEMNLSEKVLLKRIAKSQFYQSKFKQVYQQTNITPHLISQALAAFMRNIITNNSPFDEYLAGAENALSPQAKNGLALFEGKAKCIECHDGANFTDDSFHSLGIAFEDKGRANVIKDNSLAYRFKTPTLRNITLTAPYMHNGSLPDLESVMTFYNDGGGSGPNKDKLMEPLSLSQSEIRDLIAFLSALTDPVLIARPPSMTQVQISPNEMHKGENIWK